MYNHYLRPVRGIQCPLSCLKGLNHSDTIQADHQETHSHSGMPYTAISRGGRRLRNGGGGIIAPTLASQTEHLSPYFQNLHGF
eukprot:scaffold2294_cov106-Cylindrotheca_fusiformis.AAC.11